MSNQEKRDNSYSHRWRIPRKKHHDAEPITDKNVDSFIKRALQNGLDLARIAREAAERAAEEKKNSDSS